MEEGGMISVALQKAIDNLQIQDVYLRDLLAHCQPDFDPKYNVNIEGLAVQLKHFVKQSMLVAVDDQEMLRVFVELGARWLDEKEQDEAKAVKVLIEAEFVAEYLLKETLDKASIDEFSLKNASYHIWPYWRELLTNQCARMRLPCVTVPTIQLADNRHIEQAQTANSPDLRS